MTNSDHHFQIGHSHSVCEDYSASQPGFAALSDGCSCVIGPDGKPMNAHTDIGARLLVRAAFHHQREPNLHLRYRLTVSTADGYRRQLDLGVETLSATLLTIRTASDTTVEAAICGDGVIAGRVRGTSEWLVGCYQFDGPPVYPRYCLLKDPPENNLSVTSPFDGPHQLRRGSLPEICEHHLFGTESIDLVVAMSDGAFSFTKKSRPLPFDVELANRLLDFRGLKGRFVLRHLSGVLRELAEDGIVNQDDVSIIAMHVE